GALVFSLTLVPLLCAAMLKRNLPEKETFIVRAARDAYQRSLRWALRHRAVVIGAAGVALAASLPLVPPLGTALLPSLNEGEVWVNGMPTTVASVPDGQDLTRRVRLAIRSVPEVASVTSKSGRPEDGTDPKLINMAEFLVDLKPESDWRHGLDKPEVLRQM